ncbi:MAG: endonuclease [Jatrophihabitantaceae bacterium]
MAQRETIRRLLKVAGRSYASQAGIRLTDTPAPLYQLQVLTLLLSTRIAGSIAVAAARELRAAGCGTPQRMCQASWADRMAALGRAHYRRYDESTASRLGDGAQLLIDRYQGDLRRLVQRANHDTGRVAELLQEFPGVGPLGAAIFLREAQTVWTWARPYLDDRVAAAAEQFGLPHTARGLASAAGTADLSRLSAALIRASTEREVYERVVAADEPTGLARRPGRRAS